MKPSPSSTRLNQQEDLNELHHIPHSDVLKVSGTYEGHVLCVKIGKCFWDDIVNHVLENIGIYQGEYLNFKSSELVFTKLGRKAL